MVKLEQRMEQERNLELEGTKKHAETQLKELACRFEEVEDQAKKSVKKAMVKLEQRLREQEQDVGLEQQRHQETMKILKKNDRRVKELTLQSEEDRKKMIAMQELMEKLQEKVMLYKRQAEESEEASAQNLAKYRKLKREYDEAEERAENAETVVSSMRSRGGSVFGNRALSPTNWNQQEVQDYSMTQSMMMTQQQQQQVHQETSVRGGSQGGLLFSDEEMDSGVSTGTASRRTRRRVARSTQQDMMGSGGHDAGADSDYAAPSSPRYGSSSKGRGSGESTPVRSPLSRLSPDVAETGSGSGAGGKEGGWRQNFPLSLDDVKINESLLRSGGGSSEDLPPRSAATASAAAASSAAAPS